MARARVAAAAAVAAAPPGRPLLLLLLLLLSITIDTASAWTAPPLPRRPLPLSPLRTTRCSPRPTPAPHAATIPIAAITTTATAASSIPFPATLGPLAAGLHASPWWTWTMLLLASTAGVAAERTRLGAALSSPLITMGVALIGCNVGLLPATAPVRTFEGRVGMWVCEWTGRCRCIRTEVPHR